MDRRIALARIGTAAVVAGGIGIVGGAGAVWAAPSNLPLKTLKLLNGWVSENRQYSTGNPAAAVDGSGVVHLSGSIGGGTSDTEAFALPPGDAPASYLYINTYNFGDSVGYLIIEPSGAVYAVGALASGLTDLAGVTFPSAGSSLTNSYPSLENGWVSANSSFGTGDPAAAVDSDGIVHLSGSLENGTVGSVAFVLPAGDRPPADTYLETYTLSGSTGYVFISAAGDVVPEGASASGYTNLAGITFRANSSILGAKGLTLENTWRGDSFGTGKATITRDQYGVVHLAGGVTATAQTGPAFTLPSGDRPSHDLHETTYTYDGTTGEAVVYTNGEVYLQGQATSIAGISTADEYTTLTGINFQAKV